MKPHRQLAVLVAIAVAALSACTHDAIRATNGDASTGSPQPSDAPPLASDDAGVAGLPDTSAPRDAGGPPADTNTGIGSGPETGGTEVGDVSSLMGAALNPDKSTVNLGTLDVRSTGVATVTLTNTGKIASGKVTITVTAGLTATGCSGVLAAGASCTITITATPTAAGPFTGTVTIAASPGTITPLQVTVIAVVSPALLFAVTPTAIDLGNVAVGVPAPRQTITITAAVAISDLTVSTSGVDVSIDKAASTCTSALAANASCTVFVNFVAASAGSKSDAVVISGGGPSGKVVTVPITAVAQKPAQLVINPSTAQSFIATVGTTSSAITFGVANIGDVATGTIAASITGASAADFKATSTCLILAPLGACTVAVTWSPSAVATTAETANLVVTDTAVGGTSVTVQLVGGGLGGPATLVIGPASGDLGSTSIGQTSPSTVFTVTNTGDTASGNLTVAVSSTDFLITSDTCSGASLVARTGACTVAIAFKATACGSMSATLTVTGTNGSPGGKILTGLGVTPGGGLGASPAAVDFGSVRVNRTSTARTITVKTLGCSTRTGTLSFIKSGSFGEFSMTANTCVAALSEGVSCTFDLAFAPTVPGSQTASFTLTDGSVSAAVMVSGTGLAPVPVTLSPSGGVFPNTVVGQTSTSITFTLTNSSTSAVDAGRMDDTGAIVVSLAGKNPSDFQITSNGCTAALPPSAACQIGVAFAPQTTSNRVAELTIATDNGGLATAALSGTGL